MHPPGVVTLAKQLDYESNSVHLIDIKATPPNGPPAWISVTIQVSDVNEAPYNLRDGSGVANYIGRIGRAWRKGGN